MLNTYTGDIAGHGETGRLGCDGSSWGIIPVLSSACRLIYLSRAMLPGISSPLHRPECAQRLRTRPYSGRSTRVADGRASDCNASQVQGTSCIAGARPRPARPRGPGDSLGPGRDRAHLLFLMRGPLISLPCRCRPTRARASILQSRALSQPLGLEARLWYRGDCVVATRTLVRDRGPRLEWLRLRMGLLTVWKLRVVGGIWGYGGQLFGAAGLGGGRQWRTWWSWTSG